MNSSGPLGFLHPTTRYHPVTVAREQPEPISQARPLETPTSEKPTSPEETKDSRKVYHVWRSRDNRKGRRRAVVTGHRGPQSQRLGLIGEEASRLKSTALGLTRLVTRFPVWDLSYLVAVAFVLGLLAPFLLSLFFLFSLLLSFPVAISFPSSLLPRLFSLFSLINLI